MGPKWLVLVVVPGLLLSLNSLTGCAFGDGTICLDDSAGCVKSRLSALEAMRKDERNLWVEHKPTPREYASGVRLFAYRANKEKLSCTQLRKGIAETASAPMVLGPQSVAGVPAKRLGEIIALSRDVNAELKATAKQRRCS